MMDMSIPYEATGRTRQKQRTRNALIDAARELIADGVAPTVEEAASRASISRTTAYRYFKNRRELVVAAHPEVGARSLLGDDPPDDVEERVDRVVEELMRITIDAEPAFRTMLRLSLDPRSAHRKELFLRRGRAIGWLEDALEPARERLSEGSVRRLVHAIRASVGIEALVWLCDVAGLSPDEAVEVMRWSARSLVRSALSEARS